MIEKSVVPVNGSVRNYLLVKLSAIIANLIVMVVNVYMMIIAWIMRRRIKMLDYGFYNLDCMQGMKEFPDKYFDLAIVDPPYGLKRFKHGGSVINKYGDENGAWNNEKPSKEYFSELFRVSKNQIIWGGKQL